ncbi:MAG: hypothetical protein EOP34_12125, partial [Rickettsiales bacterium]
MIEESGSEKSLSEVEFEETEIPKTEEGVVGTIRRPVPPPPPGPPPERRVHLRSRMEVEVRQQSPKEEEKPVEMPKAATRWASPPREEETQRKTILPPRISPALNADIPVKAFPPQLSSRTATPPPPPPPKVRPPQLLVQKKE